MPSLDLKLLEETRRDICKKCEYYKRESDACNFLILKTGKLGLLNHSEGVRNPKSRCPYFLKRKWNFVPSLYAWEVDEKLFHINPHQVYEYTKARSLGAMAMIDRIYTRYDHNKENILLKRSEIIKIVSDINKRPNDYQHIKERELKVNYTSGLIEGYVYLE